MSITLDRSASRSARTDRSRHPPDTIRVPMTGPSGPSGGPSRPSGSNGGGSNNGPNGRDQGPSQSQGVQSRLTEQTFSQYLDGFQEVQASDLLEAKGGRVRYAIDTLDSTGRRIVSTQYRLGGWLVSADPGLRFVTLFNPYARKKWSVQVRPEGKRVRLYYMAPPTSDEAAMMRNLLAKLESGEIQITRGPGAR